MTLGFGFPSCKVGNKYIHPYSRHFMEKHEAMGEGKASFFHSFTHALNLQAPCWVPAPRELTTWLCALGSFVSSRHPSSLFAKVKTEVQTKPIAFLGRGDEQDLRDRAQVFRSYVPLTTSSQGLSSVWWGLEGG